MDLPPIPYTAHPNRKGTAVAVYDAAGELLAHCYARLRPDRTPDLEPALALAVLICRASQELPPRE
jgi:hypothetical protein